MTPAPAYTDHRSSGPKRWCSHCIEITETVLELNQDCLSCTGCGKVLPLAVHNDCAASQTSVNLRVKFVQPIRSEINDKESESLYKAEVMEQMREYYSEYDMEDRVVDWDDYETHETDDDVEY